MAGAVKVAAPAAIGLSVQYLVGEGRQLVVQTHVSLDASQADVDAVLDRVFRAGDRQKAKYDIEGLEDEIRKCKILMKNAREDMDRIEKDFQVRMMMRQAELGAYAEQFDKITEEDQEAHQRSGRRGEWAISVQAKRRADGVRSEIEKHKAETERMEKERENALRDQGIIMDRHEDRLTDLVRCLGAARALIG